MGRNVSREERIERQAEDPGDLDDDVYTKPISPIKFYHDDRTCYILQMAEGEPKSTTRRKAQNRWAAPCENCVL